MRDGLDILVHTSSCPLLKLKPCKPHKVWWGRALVVYGARAWDLFFEEIKKIAWV